MAAFYPSQKPLLVLTPFYEVSLDMGEKRETVRLKPLPNDGAQVVTSHFNSAVSGFRLVYRLFVFGQGIVIDNTK